MVAVESAEALFPWKVEGQLVCNDCYGKVHLPDGVANNMAMKEFKAYRMFREENTKLKRQFRSHSRWILASLMISGGAGRSDRREIYSQAASTAWNIRSAIDEKETFGLTVGFVYVFCACCLR